MRTSVPKEFTVGESLAWEKSFSDYPAGEGWAVTYYFRGAGAGFNVSGASDGDDFDFAVAGTVTQNCTAGLYKFQAFAAKDDERYLVDEGDVTVLASFISVSTATVVDSRSQVKKTLDAIDLRINGDVTKGVMEYTIDNRQLKHYSMDDLLKARDKYGKLYAAELRAENAKKGGSLIKNHYIKFNNPR